MITTLHDTLPDDQEFQSCWNTLAGSSPLRSWLWLSTWWKHYGSSAASSDVDRQLTVLFVHDEPTEADQAGELVAVLPCYVETTLLRGRVLRLLGDGEACTDHSGLIVADDRIEEVIASVAQHLANRDDWDAIHFESIDQADEATRGLFAVLAQLGVQTSSQSAQQCWAIDLPGSWDEFLALQSKSHRKQLRRAERRLTENPTLKWRLVCDESEFDAAWPVLVDLHQRRRNSLDEPGCFASKQWAAFHKDVARQLLNTNQLRLSILYDEDAPLAAEYHLAGGKTTYAYQGGVDPARLDEEPGRLSLIAAIQHAISEGHSRFDLMRGDEPYKPHWRATPQATNDLIAVPPRALARLRDGARSGLQAVRAQAKRLVSAND